MRVLDVDPELVEELPPDHAEAARRAAVAAIEELPSGPWITADGRPEWAEPGHLGLLIVSGLVARGVFIEAGRPFVELLGPGDVLRPWLRTYASVPSGESWRVMQPTRIAMLDRRFALSVSPWPEVVAALADRHVRRARGLVFHLAVCHLKRIEDRVLVVLWHLADRWGRVTPDGVVLPISLTHELIAGIVGAKRPSVTTALGELRARGLAERTDGGSWLLHGQAPGTLDLLRRRSAGVEAPEVPQPG